MSNIYTIDDGKETFTIENKNKEVVCEMRFNPSDVGLLDRYKEVVKSFDEINFESENELENIDFMNNICAEKIDYLIGADVSQEAFKVLKPMSIVTNGDFFIESLLEIIGKIIEDKTKKRIEKKIIKIKKATEKYRK